MAMATRESSHSSMSRVLVATGESKVFPSLCYRMSGESRSSGEEQPDNLPLDICAWEKALLTTGHVPSVSTWKILCFSIFKRPLWL